MSSTQIVVLVAVVVLGLALLAAVGVVLQRRRRSAELRDAFGAEYDRTVQGSGRRRDAERELAERKERHEQLSLSPLAPAARQRYLTAWGGVQSRFVDAPVLALSEADALLTRLLSERGFPTDDVQAQEDMLSVEHRHVLDSFRAGHAIEQQNTTHDADTEQVRQGMLHFREVFEAMVSEGDEPYPTDGAQGQRQRESR